MAMLEGTLVLGGGDEEARTLGCAVQEGGDNSMSLLKLLQTLGHVQGQLSSATLESPPGKPHPITRTWGVSR